MNEIKEFNELVGQLLKQLNDSIFLSQQVSQKLNTIFNDYELSKSKSENNTESSNS